MTLLQQFVDSVTGLTLPVQFRNIRIKLTVFVFIFLSLLLLLSGFNVFATTREELENFRIQINNQTNNQLKTIFQGQNDQLPNPNSGIGAKQITKEIAEQSRLETLGRIQIIVVINNAGLVILLTLITWESLYFLLKPLAKATQAREDFLIQASHELRTPLAILYSELTLSANENNIDELHNTHKEAIQEIKRLQQLSDTLLGRNEHILETISVEKTIHEAWQNLSVYNTKSVQLKVLKNYSLEIKSDPTKFYQLVFNILENAVKHGKANSSLVINLNKNELVFENESDQEVCIPGTGMSVSQKIAESLGLVLDHSHANFVHTTKLSLSK